MKKTEDINYELMEKLGDLYAATGVDWVLEVHHTLTEPCCPSAYVFPEGQHTARYRADRDSIEASINRSIELAYRELVLGESIEQDFPMTVPKPTFPWTRITLEVPDDKIAKLMEELSDYNARDVVELSPVLVQASVLEAFHTVFERRVEGVKLITVVGLGER